MIPIGDLLSVDDQFNVIATIVNDIQCIVMTDVARVVAIDRQNTISDRQDMIIAVVDLRDVQIVISVERRRRWCLMSTRNREAELSALFLVTMNDRREFLALLDQIGSMVIVQRLKDLAYDNHLDVVARFFQRGHGVTMLAVDQGSTVHGEEFVANEKASLSCGTFVVDFRQEDALRENNEENESINECLT